MFNFWSLTNTRVNNRGFHSFDILWIGICFNLRSTMSETTLLINIYSSWRLPVVIALYMYRVGWTPLESHIVHRMMLWSLIVPTISPVSLRIISLAIGKLKLPESSEATLKSMCEYISCMVWELLILSTQNCLMCIFPDSFFTLCTIYE